MSSFEETVKRFYPPAKPDLPSNVRVTATQVLIDTGAGWRDMTEPEALEIYKARCARDHIATFARELRGK